jgi:GNAT superfamily N-acetyltransferase
MTRKYTSKFADEYHEPIRSVKKVPKWSGASVALFLNGHAIGAGDLRSKDRAKKWVNTESVALKKGFRKQGHGIHLYFALIRKAKEVGAVRIYSSLTLNRLSGRMWRDKLPKFFDVKRNRPACRCKCRNCCYRRGRFYIDLEGLNVKKIPR